MIRSELVACITAQNPHLFARDVEAVVDTILKHVAEALVDGDRVELHDLSAFSVRDREACAGRNPRTGGEVVVPARAHVYFKPGRGMRRRLNIEKVDPEQEAVRVLRAELRSTAAAWPAR
jgi:integration host factor subunit beta